MHMPEGSVWRYVRSLALPTHHAPRQGGSMRKTTAMLLAVLGLSLGSILALTATVGAQGSTNGTITISSQSVAVGVGVTWGDGVLTYHGKKYPVSVNGLSVVDLGVSKISASGKVT